MVNRFVWTGMLIFLGLAANGQENRTITGIDNNLNNRSWGSAESQILRITTANYQDGISTINEANLPIPREISNRLFEQKNQIFDVYNLSDFVWVFGQFVDHDITLVESDESEIAALAIPDNDEYFSPSDKIISSRSLARPGTGISVDNPRQYSNAITAFVDGSAVYGSDSERANWLRTFENGKLKVSQGNLLPWNTLTGEIGDDIDPASPFMADDSRSLIRYFVAGDARANENPLLISMHTIFVREHNRICDELAQDHPQWDDERIYQRARKLIGAYIQNILFSEWLPALGVDLPVYRDYSDQMNPGIFNVFSAAAFRIGHTMINSNLLRMNNDGEEINSGSIRLQDAFFNPQTVVLADGIEPYFKGMGTQVMQEMDCKIIGDLRNFLFGSPGAGGMDLAAINIFRGRDRGLSDYNTLRKDFGLPGVNNFNDFVSNSEDAQILQDLYGDVNNVDAWVGMLAEQHVRGSIFGELVLRILESQFQNLRDGDRFYFENDPAFTLRERNEIKEVTLYKILMRNSNLSIMQKNLFFAMPHSDIPDGPQIENSELSAGIFPNPATNHAKMKVYSSKDQNATLSVFNANGQVIHSQNANLIQGFNFITVPLEVTWPRGMYNIFIQAGDEYNIVKLIKE